MGVFGIFIFITVILLLYVKSDFRNSEPANYTSFFMNKFKEKTSDDFVFSSKEQALAFLENFHQSHVLPEYRKEESSFLVILDKKRFIKNLVSRISEERGVDLIAA